MTEYDENALRMKQDTTPEEVREYVKERTKNPVRVREHGITVWDYSTHKTDMEALLDLAPRLRGSYFVVAYQIAAPWAYMQDLLPDEIRRLPVLAYSERLEEYKVFPNLFEEANVMNDLQCRSDLEEWLEEYDP